MKNTLLRPLALVAALSFGTITSAQAAEFTTLEQEASSIVFSYSQMNVKMVGDFGELKATELSFDPANPAAAQITLEVVLSSIEAGSVDANTELAKAEWLAIDQYPIATFTSSNVEALGDNKYQITGDLSIKGHTQTVTAPFSFTDNGDTTGIFSGSFTFQRGDYNIGEGAWSSFGIVANDIDIKFDILAKQ